MTGFDGVEDGDGDGQLVNRLHGKQFGGHEAAVESLAGESAGDADASVGLGCDGDDFGVELLSAGGKSESGEQEERDGRDEMEDATGGHW